MHLSRNNNLTVIYFLLLIIIPVLISAQNLNSINQLKNENYQINSNKNIFKYKTTQIQNRTINTSSSSLNKTVFGFFPSWLYSDSIIKNIRFDLLTHIGIYSFGVYGSGMLQTVDYWPWNKLLSLARKNQLKIILTISSSDPDTIHKILSNTISQKRLFSNVLNLIISDSLQGVNVDFENLYDNDKSALLNNFLQNFKDTLLSVNKNLELSFDSPTDNIGGFWDFQGLAQICDYLFVMCYDYYGSWSSHTGPSSPFSGGPPFIFNSIINTINIYYYNVDPQKLIMGVPYYGNLWQTTTNQPYATINAAAGSGKWISSLYYYQIISSYSQKEKNWDSISSTPFLTWQNGSTWNQLWYDNDTSLTEKYNFAIGENMLGIGIWALGYDNGRQELWNLIQKKFSAVTGVEKIQNALPTDFMLFQNYPNPFNPTTNIIYKLSTASKVQLKIYDLLGREIMTLVNEFQQTGTYIYHFSSTLFQGNKSKYQLSSGIYFYRLTAGNFSDAKKMILSR
jgi:spore germination protein YaaH